MTKRSYEDELDVVTDALTPNASVMEAIQTAEMEAQQLLTRAAALRQQHCLPTAAAQAQNPKLPSRPASNNAGRAVDLDQAERACYHSLLGSSSKRIMNRGHLEEVRTALEVFSELSRDIDNLSASQKREAPVLLEVFAGSMTLSRVAAQRGWRVLQPVDIIAIHGLDLTTKEAQTALNQKKQKWAPDVVSWAPPCGPYSPLQMIMPRNRVKRAAKVKRLKRKRQQAEGLWKYCHDRFHRQPEVQQKTVGDGQTIQLVENPWSSAAWKCYPFSRYSAKVDQCVFGLKVNDSGKKVRKRT